ncbi:MAG: 1-acyl-sn-glycerol-3-phosphate acyltransferase [Pseudomonadota bacterium]|nr:1-acyl-sn-glycerol-3-phosphate acyltransferase [Pseudomonadota bacterium]MDE3038293.1 1-acyl-sn-glycerol-3-phosphate acyltransferase [Pseudomonadota bacterium]
MIFLRSLLFNICFTAWAMMAPLLFAPLFIASAEGAQRAGSPWARGSLRLLRLICGIRQEIRGGQYIAGVPVIYACKHQSAWDTVALLAMLPRPAYVLKRELIAIPLWGWYLWRMKMIAIDRSKGAGSIKQIVRQAQQAVNDGRPVVIYPEGTRTVPGAAAHYHPGIAALYSQLGIPVVPVALNSGLYWGRNAFFKRPGTIAMEFLPPIAPGLPRREFMARLKDAIETASQKLLEDSINPVRRASGCAGSEDPARSLRNSQDV